MAEVTYELAIFKDDNEFEEFDLEDWTKEDEDRDDLNVWDEDWDQIDVEDEFTEQLRSEIQRLGHLS